MKYSEIASLEPAELRKRLGLLKKKLFDARISAQAKKLSNPLIIRSLRRDAARLMTALSAQKLRERARSVAGAGAAAGAAPAAASASKAPLESAASPPSSKKTKNV